MDDTTSHRLVRLSIVLAIVGALINAAVEDGRLLDMDVFDLRSAYRQRAVVVHTDTVAASAESASEAVGTDSTGVHM